jgi:hypothetical protein
MTLIPRGRLSATFGLTGLNQPSEHLVLGGLAQQLTYTNLVVNR